MLMDAAERLCHRSINGSIRDQTNVAALDLAMPEARRDIVPTRFPGNDTV
jgi:hypothetical protein